MQQAQKIIRQQSLLLMSFVLVAALLSSTFIASRAFAAGQVASRSIKMSSGVASATASYQVSFTPATTGAQSLVIDFCSNSSIIGASCTAPSSFSASSASFTAGTGTTGWALGTLTANTVKVTKSSGSALGTSAISFTLGNITNPSDVGSFYARVYTYSDAAYGGGSAYASPTSIGNDLDYGGFALSTTTQVTVSATVMETLTFCVSKASPGNGCTSTTAPALTLGHGSPLTLDSTAVDTDTAYTQISTNATNGAVVNMKNTSSATCAGLSRDGGTTCGIPAKGSFGTMTAGTAAFGLNVADGTGGTGTVTANANYGTTAGSYGMGNNTYSATYGDAIMSSSSVCANVNSLLTFGATASATTAAGVYTVNESLVATSTY